MMLFWLIMFIIFVHLEIITINLVTIWFALGAVGALVTNFFTDSFLIQTIVFLVVSVISLVLTRPFVKKFNSKRVATNADSVIGKIGIVTKVVTRDFPGRVKVDGQDWAAIVKEDITLQEGTKIKVTEIQGVKLIVMEVN